MCKKTRESGIGQRVGILGWQFWTGQAYNRIPMQVMSFEFNQNDERTL